MKLSYLTFALLLGGCASGTTLAVQQAEVASYAAQEQQCVALATTKAQADACIASVQQFWCGDGGALSEAGACGPGLDAAVEAGE